MIQISKNEKKLLHLLGLYLLFGLICLFCFAVVDNSLKNRDNNNGLEIEADSYDYNNSNNSSNYFYVLNFTRDSEYELVGEYFIEDNFTIYEFNDRFCEISNCSLDYTEICIKCIN